MKVSEVKRRQKKNYNEVVIRSGYCLESCLSCLIVLVAWLFNWYIREWSINRYICCCSCCGGVVVVIVAHVGRSPINILIGLRPRQHQDYPEWPCCCSLPGARVVTFSEGDLYGVGMCFYFILSPLVECIIHRLNWILVLPWRNRSIRV